MSIYPHDKDRPALAGKLGISNEIKRPDNNSLQAQRASILHWFLNVSNRLSTLDAREILGVMSPACRIFELRQIGHKIQLEWLYQEDTTGTRHRVGVYLYMGFGQKLSFVEA